MENNVKLYFGTKSLNLPVIMQTNRYFIPLIEFIKLIGGKTQQNENTIYIFFKNHSPSNLDLKSNDYKSCIIKNKMYISLFDLCRMLKLKSVWNYEKQRIYLYHNQDNENVVYNHNDRPAYIRFEDYTAEEMYLTSENLSKMRVIADYLYRIGTPFHIAWIPRFLNPTLEIDNDISIDFNMPNAHFLFTLEYLLSKNGILGLHGYTHQYGDEVSGEGTEFSETRNTDETTIRSRTQAATQTANNLSLPFAFFETPHYAATEFQQSIFEQYFDIIYEGCVGIWGEKIVKSPRNNRTLYIPTPLGYVEGENGLEEMIERIESIGPNSLASLFYHPFAEFGYIRVNNDGYPFSTYLEDSPLHQMINALYKKGCTLKRITKIT